MVLNSHIHSNPLSPLSRAKESSGVENGILPKTRVNERRIWVLDAKKVTVLSDDPVAYHSRASDCRWDDAEIDGHTLSMPTLNSFQESVSLIFLNTSTLFIIHCSLLLTDPFRV